MAVYSPTSTTRAGYGALAGRILLSLLGAAGMIIGAFLHWLRGIQGTRIPAMALFDVKTTASDRFVTSLGFVLVVLGLVAIVGLVPRTGWLTRLAGALGLAAWILFVIQLYRLPGDIGVGDIRVGGWLALIGSLIALVGGFFGSRQVVVAAAPASTTTVVEP